MSLAPLCSWRNWNTEMLNNLFKLNKKSSQNLNMVLTVSRIWRFSITTTGRILIKLGKENSIKSFIPFSFFLRWVSEESGLRKELDFSSGRIKLLTLVVEKKVVKNRLKPRDFDLWKLHTILVLHNLSMSESPEGSLSAGFLSASRKSYEWAGVDRASSLLPRQLTGPAGVARW